MSKDINLTGLTNSSKQVLVFAKKYAGFTFFVVVICLYSFLVFRISTLAQVEPTDEQVVEKTGVTKQLKIDQNSISKIEQLKDQNVGVQSLFDEARQNPFQD